MLGQTYQCQDAVSMFLQGTGLIVRILKNRWPIKDLPVDWSFLFSEAPISVLWF
jgi:hypothetical protein